MIDRFKTALPEWLGKLEKTLAGNGCAPPHPAPCTLHPRERVCV